MAITVASVMSEIGNRYKIPTERCLALINEAHNDLTAKLPILANTETITLTTASSYPLDSDIERIRYACHVDSDGNKTTLQGKSERELDLFEDGWRDYDATEIPDYYIVEQTATGGQQVTFSPPPNASGTVVLYVSRSSVLTFSSSLPECINSWDYYKYAVFEKHAEVSDFPNEQRWAQKKEEALARLTERIQSISTDVVPALYPWMGQSGGRV